MTPILTNGSFAPVPRSSVGSVIARVRRMFSNRREIMKISTLARRKRLQRGYRHIPQRVWDRHSALFIDD